MPLGSGVTGRAWRGPRPDGASSIRQPVLHFEVWDPVEVTDVAGHDDQSSGECDRGDAQVGLVQPSAIRLQASSNRSIGLSGPLVEGKDRQGVDNEFADLLGQGGTASFTGSTRQLSA